MSSGSQQAGNITTTQAPAPYMQPFIGTGLGQANSLLKAGGPNYYTGNTVAGFSQPQQEAMAGIQNLGMNGTPALGAANRFDTMLLNGGGSNPWLDRTFNQAADSTQNRLASEYAGSGMDVRNSAPLRAQQLNNLATDIYGGNYNNTLNAALNAGNQAQSLYGTQMSGLNAAQGVGQQVQNQAQQLIDASRGAYNYNQMQPYQNLQQYETYLGGVSPGMSTQSPYFTNPTANALGTAMGGLGVYNAGKTAGLWGSGKGAAGAAGA